MTPEGLPRQRPSEDGRPGYDPVRVAAMLDQLAGDFAQFDEALDADLWMSSTVGHLMLQIEPEENAQQTMQWAVEDVLRYVEETPTPVAVAFLRAAEILVPMGLRSRVLHALTNAALAGVPDPSWARHVAMRVGPCWRIGAEGGPHDEVVVSFTDDRGRGHLVHTVIGSSGQILDIGFADDVQGYRRANLDAARSVNGQSLLEDLTPEQARERLMPALSKPLDLGEGEHVAESIGYLTLLRSRVGLLPAPAGAAFFRG